MATSLPDESSKKSSRLGGGSEEDSSSNNNPSAAGGSGSNNEEDGTAAFECNICLDTARDAVISLCGHLFCWPCLHQWLETRPNSKSCPVCKSAISKEKVVPLYGRGNTQQKDPRDKVIPPRPRGTRSEPENNGSGNPFNGFGFGGLSGGGAGSGMTFGIGAFPFGVFANLSFGADNNRHRPAAEGSAQYEEERFLHKVFLWVAFAFLFWLLIA